MLLEPFGITVSLGKNIKKYYLVVVGVCKLSGCWSRFEIEIDNTFIWSGIRGSLEDHVLLLIVVSTAQRKCFFALFCAPWDKF